MNVLTSGPNFTFAQQFQNPGVGNYNFSPLLPNTTSIGFTLRSVGRDFSFYSLSVGSEAMSAIEQTDGAALASQGGDVTLQNIGAVPVSVGAGVLSSLLFGLGVVGAVLGRRRSRSRLRA